MSSVPSITGIAPLHPWQWPDKPWSRLHPDFAGPFLGRMYLILVDAHSKWMDAVLMSDITSSQTNYFCYTWITKENCYRQWIFFRESGIQGIHVTEWNFTSLYHPSTNGLAERAVQTFKQGLKRTTGCSIQDRLSRFLFQY